MELRLPFILRPVLLQIPVKPYSLKFLERHLGADYKLSSDDPYGRYLFGLLRTPRIDRQYDEHLGRYTQKFPVRIVPHLVADRACKNCSSLTIVHFNSFVERLFYTEFHSFVQARVEDNLMSTKEAIERFCTRFDLMEDDVHYDTLKRNWNRYWKKEKKRLEPAKTPSGLSLAA